MLFTAGYRLDRLPEMFWSYETVVFFPWAHECTVVPVSGLIAALNGRVMSFYIS